MMAVDTMELRKAAHAVYLATVEHVADDISRMLMQAANEIERLRAGLRQIGNLSLSFRPIVDRLLAGDASRDALRWRTLIALPALEVDYFEKENAEGWVTDLSRDELIARIDAAIEREGKDNGA